MVSSALEAIEPCEDVRSVFPIDEFVDLRIDSEHGLGVFDKLLLYVFPLSEIQVQIVHGGLHVFMPQVVSNIGDGIAASEPMDGAGMPEAVSGGELSETFRRQDHGQIFFAQPMDAVSCKSLFALIDKQALLEQGLWSDAIFGDIQLDELGGFKADSYLAIAICLSQNDKGSVLIIEGVELEGCDLRGPCARVVEQMQDGIVAEALIFLEVNGLEDLVDFFRM